MLFPGGEEAHPLPVTHILIPTSLIPALPARGFVMCWGQDLKEAFMCWFRNLPTFLKEVMFFSFKPWPQTLRLVPKTKYSCSGEAKEVFLRLLATCNRHSWALWKIGQYPDLTPDQVTQKLCLSQEPQAMLLCTEDGKAPTKRVPKSQFFKWNRIDGFMSCYRGKGCFSFLYLLTNVLVWC
jgi:hypothetical protein